jgi:4-amino-4-deoxy-L-arabinose transferase-like glycosyltransferase
LRNELKTATRTEAGLGGAVATSTHREALLTLRAHRLLVLTLFVIGVTLRVVYYFSDPRFSPDEASLALNVMHRSYGGLLERLDFNQAAPPGFLMLQKLVVDAIGASPRAFRLAPLAASLGALVLVYPIGRRLVSKRAAILGLALVAVSEPLISYAATNKQYSVDVAAAAGLTYVALRYQSGAFPRPGVLLALLGAGVVWFSHPSAFVLAGIGAAFILEPATKRQWTRAAASVVIASIWLLSFVLAYVVTRQSIEQVQTSVASAGTSALFGENGSPGLLQRLGGIARNLLGIPGIQHGLRGVLVAAALLLLLVGAIALARRAPYRLLLLATPALLAAVTAATHLYLLYPRAFLFLIPFLAILIAGGADALASVEKPNISPLVAICACISLIVATSYAAVHQLLAHDQRALPQALHYLAAHAERGDSLYVDAASQYDFRYYMESGSFGTSRLVDDTRALWPILPAAGHDQFAPALKSAPPALVVGTSRTDDVNEYRRDLRELHGRSRVWIFVGDASPEGRRALKRVLDQFGTRLDGFPNVADPRSPDLYLYDLRPGA